MLLSKSEFARQCGVSPQRVGQWISEGKLTDDAIVGEGRKAKINVPIALEQLKERLDPTQRFSLNGLSSRLNGEAPPAPRKSARPELEEELKSRTNLALWLISRLQEKDPRGSDESIFGLTVIAQEAFKLFDTTLVEIARAITQQHGMSTEEILKLFRATYEEVREQAIIWGYTVQSH
jgi:hypothetical protein